MGCISSKILTKSRSLQEELSQTFHRRSNEELFGPKNGGDQLLALFYTANTVCKATKAAPPVSKESETNSIEDTAPVDHTEMTKPGIETINKWELLDGLEEESEAATNSPNLYSNIMNNNSTDSLTRSFHTVEEYDALIEEERETENHRRETDTTRVITIRSDQKSSKRKNMAKELTVLDIPSFDFPRIGSLRDWLGGGGGKVNSPGNYVTPKFGHPAQQITADDHSTVFDPDMISQFEEAMMQLTEDEEFIVSQIMESSEEDRDIDSMRMTEMLHELILQARKD